MACELAAVPDHPDLLVTAARAWQRAQKLDRALAAAERAMGTSADASARQVAGIVREQLGEHRVAHKLLQEALDAHSLAHNHLELARDEQGLTGVFLHERRLSEALDAATQCIREAERAREPRLLGYAHLAHAEVLSTLGDAPTARRAFVDALATLSAPRDAVWVLLKHGLLVLALEEYASAIELLSRALEMAESAGVAAVVDAAHLNLAFAEHRLGHPTPAQRHLNALAPSVLATSNARYVAGLVAADRGELAVADQLLAQAAEDPDDDDYAWAIAVERGVVAERRGDHAAAERFARVAITSVEAIRTRTAERELRPWVIASRRRPYEALFALLAAQQRGADALAVAEQLHARTWLDAISARTATAPAPGHTAFATSPLSTAGLLATLGDREALVYVTAAHALWRIHVDPAHRVHLARLPDDVRTLVMSWRDHPDDIDLAAQLGDRLIPTDLVADDRPLYLVAGDLLTELPFPALRRAGRFLIDERPLVRLPGLAALRCIAPPAITDAMIAVADARGDLPQSRKAAEAVARRLAGHAFVGDAATLASATSAPHARLFHAAVHAELGPDGGALQLADGELTGATILARAIAPQVAVLAGCATAASRDDERWGALPSALLAAGSQAVVATLRPVLDGDAAALINDFYNKGGDRHPARSLALAQRAAHQRAALTAWAWFAAWGHAEPDECTPIAPVTPR